MLSPVLTNKLVILTGDIKFYLTDYKNTNDNNYISFLSSYQFLPVISKPTRFAHNHPNINPFTLEHRCLNRFISVLSGTMHSYATDHFHTLMCR